VARAAQRHIGIPEMEADTKGQSKGGGDGVRKEKRGCARSRENRSWREKAKKNRTNQPEKTTEKGHATKGFCGKFRRGEGAPFQAMQGETAKKNALCRKRELKVSSMVLKTPRENKRQTRRVFPPSLGGGE